MSSQEYLTFTNPRLFAQFNDWPLGGNRRGTCTFEVEEDTRSKKSKGWRFKRWTEGNKPKVSTFAGKAAIVDGSDGRTYVIQHSRGGVFINIWRSDLLSAGVIWAAASYYYDKLSDLIAEANPE